MKLHAAVLLLSASAAVAVVAAPGCGPMTSGIQGTSCSGDGDCNPGLSCLPYEGFKDGGAGSGCSSAGKQCLARCQTDADCKPAGPGLVCFTACGSGACEAPGYLGVPLPDAGAD